jgi:hypothetical protein
MKTRRKTLVVIGSVVAALLIALVTVPLLFADQIAARVKTEVNRAINARVDWRDAGLSLFGDFPNLTLRLDDLSIAGAGRFAGDTLTKVGRLGVVLDLGSVIRNLRSDAPVVVRSIAIDRPRVRLRVLEDGTANWDIAKPAPPGTKESQPVTVTLRSLEIRDANISLDDRQSRLEAKVAGLRQSLSGDFAKELFTLATRAHADSLTVHFSGVPYLNHVALNIDADMNADTRAGKFTFAKNEIRLNDLALGFSGSVTAGKENTTLDVAFKTPRTEFRHILSLIPAIYTNDFRNLKTSGTLSLDGRVKGEYGPRAFPAFAVVAKVNDGAFQYPDLPLPARDIALDLTLRNPGGHVDSTVVRLDRFHAAIGGEPIDGAMVLRTPVSDPDVDLRLTGKLDLGNVRKTVKLASVEQLAGRVDADVAVKTRMSYVDRKQYDRIAARGNVVIRDLTLVAKDLPHPLGIQEASLRFTPQRADLESFSGKIGSSDLRLSGYLENLVPFALRGDPLRGNATFASQHFNLDEWKSDDSLTIIPVPANLDVGLQATVAELTYGKLTMTNARGALRVKDRRATLENFTMNALGGGFGVSGFYETTDSIKPKFDVQLAMKSVDIPTTFSSLVTVQMLAPVARFAKGHVSTDVHMSGALGKNMMPLFDVLSGKGSLETSELLVQGLPLLGRLADAVKLSQLRSPTLDSLRASFEIRDGRMYLKPFQVGLGKTLMRVEGSHGIDQSLQYTLGLRVPRSELGPDANRAIAALVSRAGKTGIDLQTAESVSLDIRVGGTLTSPTIQTNLGDVVASAGQSVKQAAQTEIAERVDSAKARADSAANAAKQKAREQAGRVIAEAEQRAAEIRAEAQKLADNVRREGNERADTLEARATNPVAKAAARAAANRLRKEANDKADGITREANKRADDLVAKARKDSTLIG